MYNETIISEISDFQIEISKVSEKAHHRKNKRLSYSSYIFTLIMIIYLIQRLLPVDTSYLNLYRYLLEWNSGYSMHMYSNISIINFWDIGPGMLIPQLFAVFHWNQFRSRAIDEPRKLSVPPALETYQSVKKDAGGPRCHLPSGHLAFRLRTCCLPIVQNAGGCLHASRSVAISARKPLCQWFGKIRSCLAPFGH